MVAVVEASIALPDAFGRTLCDFEHVLVADAVLDSRVSSCRVCEMDNERRVRFPRLDGVFIRPYDSSAGVEDTAIILDEIMNVFT